MLEPEGWTGVKSSYGFYTAFPFCFPIKVVIDDQIVGLVATIVHSDVAWLGHVIVDAEYRLT